MAYYYDEPANDYGHEQFDPNDEPVCICPEYAGAKPTFCHACGCYTDETELRMIDAAELDAEEEIPALPRITTPVYVMTIPAEDAA